MKKIGIITNGGDCPGLNAVIYGCAQAAKRNDFKLFGIKQKTHKHETYELVQFDQTFDDRMLIERGGTILGSIVESDLYRHNPKQLDSLKHDFKNVAKTLDALIIVAGDGGIAIDSALCADNDLPFVVIPKTIDNDIFGTTAIGAQTVVEYVTQDIDRIFTTATSHKRIMIVEVMGRDAGFIALHAGIAACADVILIPEIPYNLDNMKDFIKDRYETQANGFVMVVAEGVQTNEGQNFYLRFYDTNKGRLGGIGEYFSAIIENELNLPSRCVRLGHLQRGGKPCARDRFMGLLMGQQAIELIKEKKFSTITTFENEKVSFRYLKDISEIKRHVTDTKNWLKKTSDLGIYMGQY